MCIGGVQKIWFTELFPYLRKSISRTTTVCLSSVEVKMRARLSVIHLSIFGFPRAKTAGRVKRKEKKLQRLTCRRKCSAKMLGVWIHDRNVLQESYWSLPLVIKQRTIVFLASLWHWHMGPLICHSQNGSLSTSKKTAPSVRKLNFLSWRILLGDWLPWTVSLKVLVLLFAISDSQGYSDLW